MKKFLFLVVATLIGCMASAQIVQSTMVTKEKKQRKVEWILRAGLSIDNFSGDVVDDYNETCIVNSSFGSKTGYDVSIGYNLPIGRSGIYWGQELGMSSMGTDMKLDFEDGEYVGKGNFSVTAHRAKLVPIQFGYKYKIKDNIKLDAHVGCYVSYNFLRSVKYNYEIFKGNEIIFQRDHNDDGYHDDDYCFRNLIADFDAGIHIGIGVWYKRYNLDICYQPSVKKSYDTTRLHQYFDHFYHGAKSQSTIIRLGVSF